MIRKEVSKLMKEFQCDELHAVNILLQLVAEEEAAMEAIEFKKAA